MTVEKRAPATGSVRDDDAVHPGVAPMEIPEHACGYAELGFEFLLDGLQSPVNIGMILRVAETYQFRVSIRDRFRVLGDPEKLGTIQDFACGAVERRGFGRIADDAAVGQLRRGRRLIATSIEPSAAALPAHRFQPGDIIVLGNEYDGLPDSMLAGADAVLNIPMPEIWTPKPKAHRPIDPNRTAPVARDGRPNLNVAMTAAIICYAAYAGSLEREDGKLPGGTRNVAARRR